MNALGQRTGVTATGSTFSGITAPSWSLFSYNPAGEVTGATHASDSTRNRSCIFDSIGNRKNSRNGTDPAVGYLAANTNKYTEFFNDTNNNGAKDGVEAATGTPAHDDDGNMTNDGGSGATARTFVRDAENRLIEVWNKAATPKKLASYTYDYKSRRVKKQTTADAPQGATHIAYLYDGWNVIAEYNLAAGNPSASPVKRHDRGLDLSGSRQGAGGVGGLIRTHLNALTWFPCYDGNGNLTELRLASTGGFAAQYQYDPFGREITSSGLVSSHNFYRFSTKPFDRETEFCYYGYRYYNPVLGRWLNRDPIGERGGVSLYAFVWNSAIGEIDAYGLCVKGSKSDCVVDEPERVYQDKTDREILEESKVPAATITGILALSVTGGPTLPGGKAIDHGMDIAVQAIENIAMRDLPNAAEVAGGISIGLVKNLLLKRKYSMELDGYKLRFTVKWKECVSNCLLWTKWVEKSEKYETGVKKPWGVDATEAARREAKKKYCPWAP